MTAQEASVILAMLMAAYPNARVPDGTVAAYESFIVELERDRALEAVRGIIRTSKFMPTIAEIVTAYDALVPRRSTDGYRLFRPRQVNNAMPPSELKDAIAKALEGMK